MKLLINLILVLCCVSAQAASVRNYLRNPFTNEIDTNALIVTKISTNILADGGVIAIGRPQRFPFSPYTNTLAIGFYSVSNINLRSAYVINVDDASSTLYDCTNLLHSGFNTYVVVQPTFSRITNALGYLPATNGSSGGVNVTGAQLAATTTNAGVVTVSVPTNSVVSVIQQQFAAGSNTFTGTATLSGFSASGNLNMNINGGTVTAGANTMSPSGFSTTGGTLNPTGFAGNAYGATNVPGVKNGATNASGQVLATTADLPNQERATNSPLRRYNADAAGREPKFFATTWNTFYDSVPTLQDALPSNGLEQKNLMRWATNTVYWFKTNGFADAGVGIMFDDFWQERTNGRITWNTNLFPMGMPEFIKFAHTNGVKVYAYSSVSTNTCNTNGVSSPINYIYQDVQDFMSWGLDGHKGDTCFSGHEWPNPEDERNYYIRYFRIQQQAIDDYHYKVSSTGGVIRPYWTFAPFTVQGAPRNTQTLDSELAGGVNAGTLNWIQDGSVAGYPWSGIGWLSNGVALARLSVSNAPLLDAGFTASLESIGSGGFNAYTHPYASNLVDVLNICQSVRAMLMGNFCTWWYGTITNQFGGVDNGGSPIFLYNAQAQYWTNQSFLSVYRDPSTKISRIVQDTNGVLVLCRELQNPNSDARAITFFNLNYTNTPPTNVTVSWRHFGGRSDVTYVLLDVWANTSTTFTGSFTETLRPYSTKLYKIYPQQTAAATVSRVITNRVTWPFQALRVSGTGTGKTTAGASPFFQRDGFEQSSAANAGYVDIPCPPGTTNAILRYRCYSTFSGTVAWTNEIYVDYYYETGRVQKGPSSSPIETATTRTPVYLSAANTAVWITNSIPVVDTNAPKWILLQMNPSTNTSARYIVGPIEAEYIEYR